MKKLIKLMHEAGKIALDSQKVMTVSHKADTSIVTNGDLAVSKFLEKKLKKLYPDYDIFSEENCSNIPKSKKVIIIDPIDGTESYSRKEDTWSILVGFLDDMVPVGGVIYQPTLDLLYYGFKGEGAHKISKNEVQKLTASGTGTIKGIQSFKDYGESEYLTRLGIEDVQFMYSAALKIMKVAEGEIDAYPNFRNQCSLWDLVAPTAILEEAGGRISYRHEIAATFNDPRVKSDFCAFGIRLKDERL
jgi:3'-phosphoadenosine 5'-phosphosulfate (PAPS) 3'-phosphatase